jgi:hypothetical protein
MGRVIFMLLLPASTVAVLLVPALFAASPREPPLAEVYSGKALNALLREVSAAHSKGVCGPKVPLDAGLLRRVNLAPPGGGNFALLKGGGKLRWTVALREERFRGDREQVTKLVGKALRDLKRDPTKAVRKSIIADLAGALRRLGDGLAEEVADLSPSQYIEARRYLNQLGEAVKVLQSPGAGRFVEGTYAARGSSVAELVEHLRQHSLGFAPAVQGEEKAYRDLYDALAAYRAGLTPR